MDFKALGLTFVALFVALDILGTLPMYLSMTQGMNPKRKARTVDVSMLVAFVVAVLFAVGGQPLFRWLGIDLFDFKIAGGIVLLLLSLADLVSGPEAASRASGSTGIVPLAVPLITGPGVLTTLVLQVNSVGYVVTFAALAGNYLVAWVLLRKSDKVTLLIGKDGTVVFSKIAALLLAAIAIAMIRGGIFGAIEAFRAGQTLPGHG